MRFGAEVYIGVEFPVKNRNSAMAELGVTEVSGRLRRGHLRDEPGARISV